MTTLYIDRKDIALDIEGGALVLREPGGTRTLPLGPVERVVLRGPASLTARLLAGLWERNIGLLLLSGRRSEPSARLLGRPHNDVTLRLAQFRLLTDAERRGALARELVLAKIAAQRRLLRSLRDRRPDRRKPLGGALAALDRIAAGAQANAAAATDLAVLNGIEGAAAAAYFRAYAALFPASLGFAGRRRRPPPDPVNCALSLGYTLLHFEAVRESHSAGLDPLLGFYHQPAFGRESLASDLIEPLRPHIDEWVWELFRERRLRPEHFTAADGACLLGKAGRQIFYGAYEPLGAPLRRLLRRSCRRLVSLLRGGAAPPESA